MQRRHLLAALGPSAVSLSGCVGSLGSGESSQRSTTSVRGTTTGGGTTTDGSTTTGDDSTETTTSEDAITRSIGEPFETESGTTVAVDGVRVRKSVTSGGVHYDPVSLSGKQFVVADVSVGSPVGETTAETGYPRSRELDSQFRVALGGTRYPERDRVFYVGQPSDDSRDVRLAFPVPAPATVEHGAVVWVLGVPEVRWTLDADHLDALAHPPEFEVREFAVPDEVARGAAFDVTLTVANVGSGDGTFLAELGATTISDTPEIRIDVPAGDTVTVEREVKPYYPDESNEMTMVLNWDVDHLKRTVGVAD